MDHPLPGPSADGHDPIAWLASFSASRRTPTVSRRREVRGWQADDFASVAPQADGVAEAVTSDGDRLQVSYDTMGAPVAIMLVSPAGQWDVSDRADMAHVPVVAGRDSMLADRARRDLSARTRVHRAAEEQAVADRIAIAGNNLARSGWTSEDFTFIGDLRPALSGFVADARLADGTPVEVTYSPDRVPTGVTQVGGDPQSLLIDADDAPRSRFVQAWKPASTGEPNVRVIRP